MVRPTFDFSHLSLDERILLVEDLWDSIAEVASERLGVLPLTEAQRAELARRREAHRRDPGAAIPWEDVRAELFAESEADHVGDR